jgi:hypothetical protein
MIHERAGLVCDKHGGKEEGGWSHMRVVEITGKII